ncbi:methyltransferase domain-containing protein [archaeon]|nr:MAG: methyltransferase domain-containing protein [archaeon]
MGCGEARLGATVPNKVHSFDLVAANESVVATDISKVPLTNEAVDIVVFCLSLMGTNFMDFLKEGMRVLRPGGRLLIAEVQSRFQQDAAAGEAAGAPGPTASARPGDKRRRDGGATASHSRSASVPSSEAAAGLASKKLPPGIASFADAVARLGCRLERHDTRNPMFALLFFRKLGSSAPGATPSESSGGAASTTPALSVRERTGHEGGKRKKQRHAEAASSHMNVKKAGPASVSDVLPRKHMPGGTPPRAGAGGPTRKSEHGRSPRSAAAASDDTNRHDASTAATAPLLKACIYKRR